MRVRIRFFAGARELVGNGVIEQNVADGASVQDVVEGLLDQDVRAPGIGPVAAVHRGRGLALVIGGDAVPAVEPHGRVVPRSEEGQVDRGGDPQEPLRSVQTGQELTNAWEKWFGMLGTRPNLEMSAPVGIGDPAGLHRLVL